MDCVLARDDKTQWGIFGHLTSAAGQVWATLEHAYPVGDGFEPKLAPGVYRCVRYFSPDHGYDVFLVEGVPPFHGHPVSYLELHIGNENKDSKGCVLVGERRVGLVIVDSRESFKQFMAAQAGVQSFMLTVQDAPRPPTTG